MDNLKINNIEKQIKVSVLIPCYNRPDFLKKALDSILEQSFQEFEIIIADDSTNEDCLNLLKQYNDTRIKYFHNQSPLGSPKNWNFAISKSCGEYIKFLHYDDWFIHKKSLELFVTALDENPNSDFAFSQSVDININTLSETTHDFSDKIENIREDVFYLFPNNVIGAPSTTIYRNKYNLLFDEKLKWVVDIDFYLQILLKNEDFVYIPETLVAIGLSNEQITNQCVSNKEVELFEWNYLYKKYEDKIPNKKLQQKFLKKLLKKYNRNPVHVFANNKFIALIKKIKSLLMHKN